MTNSNTFLVQRPSGINTNKKITLNSLLQTYQQILTNDDHFLSYYYCKYSTVYEFTKVDKYSKLIQQGIFLRYFHLDYLSAMISKFYKFIKLFELMIDYQITKLLNCQVDKLTCDHGAKSLSFLFAKAT